MLRHFSFLIRENQRRGGQLSGLGVSRQVDITRTSREQSPSVSSLGIEG